jgi:hypothetical protein
MLVKTKLARITQTGTGDLNKITWLLMFYNAKNVIKDEVPA